MEDLNSPRPFLITIFPFGHLPDVFELDHFERVSVDIKEYIPVKETSCNYPTELNPFKDGRVSFVEYLHTNGAVFTYPRELNPFTDDGGDLKEYLYLKETVYNYLSELNPFKDASDDGRKYCYDRGDGNDDADIFSDDDSNLDFDPEIIKDTKSMSVGDYPDHLNPFEDNRYFTEREKDKKKSRGFFHLLLDVCTRPLRKCLNKV